MKLTRSELTHAQDPQLAALGVRRAGHSGWLKKALAAEFTAEQVRMFHSARRKAKLPAGVACDTRHNFGRPRLEQSGVGTLAIADRFLAGESVAILAEDYGVPMSEIESAIRFEVRPKPKDTAREFAVMELVGLQELRDHTPKNDPIAQGLLDGKIDEAERFANELFEQSGRDLS